MMRTRKLIIKLMNTFHKKVSALSEDTLSRSLFTLINGPWYVMFADIQFLLLLDFDKARAGELVNVLREAGQTVPESLTKYGTHVKKKEHKLYGAHFKAGAEGAPAKPTRITFD